MPARIMLNLQASLRARSFFVSLSRRFEPFLASIISLARLELAYKAKCRDRLLVPSKKSIETKLKTRLCAGRLAANRLLPPAFSTDRRIAEQTTALGA